MYVFALFWALGVLFSLAYIFFVGLLRGKLAAAIFDGLFGAFAVWLIWRVNLDFNNGQLRLYIFVALALGCAAAYFTCRRTLDKLSSLLYTWFTTKVSDRKDDKAILQKVNGDSLHSGDIGADTVGADTVGNADADDVAQSARRTAGGTDRRRKKAGRNHAGTRRLSQNRRLRKKMGGRKRQDTAR